MKFFFIIFLLVPNLLIAQSCTENLDWKWFTNDNNQAVFTIKNTSLTTSILIKNVEFLDNDNILQSFKPSRLIPPKTERIISISLNFFEQSYPKLLASLTCEDYMPTTNKSNISQNNQIDKQNDDPTMIVIALVVIGSLIIVISASAQNIRRKQLSYNYTNNEEKNEKVIKKDNKPNELSEDNSIKKSKDSNIKNQINNNSIKMKINNLEEKVSVSEMSDEKIYELIAEEFDSNRRKGLWLKCEIESDMNQIKAKKLYVQTRYDEIKSSDEIKINKENQIDEKEELSPTIQALMKLRFKEELSLDGYDKLDIKFKNELVKYIYSVIEEYLNVQKAAVQTVGQKFQKDDSERNFLVYILFEYGCIDGMFIILNISPEVGQKISIEYYNLQNETFPDKKFDAQKRKEGIGELLTNQDTLEIARQIHQKAAKSVSQFLIEQDDTASLDIINFLNDEKIQFKFSEKNISEESSNIDDLLSKIANFYNSYRIGLLGNPEKLKKYGKEQFEDIVNSSKFFELASKHYDEGDGEFMALTKAKTSLILFSLCKAEKLEEVDKDLEELLRKGDLIDLSSDLLNSLKIILGKLEATKSGEDFKDYELPHKVEEDDNEYIHPRNCSIDEFEEKIKMAIPVHEASSLPRIGDVEGNKFSCGCGHSHIMNFEEHFFIADMRMFKAVFLSPECGYLNALKLKKMFSSEIENLFNTKFLQNEENYGFKNRYPDIITSIKIALRN